MLKNENFVQIFTEKQNKDLHMPLFYMKKNLDFALHATKSGEIGESCNSHDRKNPSQTSKEQRHQRSISSTIQVKIAHEFKIHN